MVSAKDDELDKIVGLELGADDYITKPFGVREVSSKSKSKFKKSMKQQMNLKIIRIKIEDTRREKRKR